MAIISLELLPQLTNERFYPLYSSTSRHLHLYGGAGSSKSHFAAQKMMVRCLLAEGKGNGFHHLFYCFRKTQPAARKSIWELFKKKREVWNLAGDEFEISESTMTFRIGNSRICCGGLDEPDKLKSAEGATGFWIEEAPEFTQEDLRQVNLRLRGEMPGTYKQILYTYNPVDINSHLYDKLYRDLPQDQGYTGPVGDDTFIHHSTYHDNRFIDAEYVKELEGLEKEDVGFHRIYCLGLWGALKHLIYRDYIVESWDSDKKFEDECFGIDFGFNNPSALVKISVADQEPWIREVIYESKLTNSDLIEEMKKRIAGADLSLPIYADNAEPARIQEIAEAGFCISPATEGKKCVKDRIDFCKSRRIHVHPDDVNIKREITTYKYKENRLGQVLDEPVKFADHAMNAFEYGFYEHFRCATTPGIFAVS